MAFLFKHPKSKFFFAGWKDETGKRINRSTGVPAKQSNRRKAQKIADEFEEASRNAKTAKRVRQTLIELQKEILGDEKATATAREYAAKFLELKKGEAGPSSVGMYKRSLDRFLEWAGEKADKDIGAFVPSEFVQYRNHLLTLVKPSTALNQMKAVRAMFKLAHEEGLAPDNPLATLKLTRGKTGGQLQERRAFRLDELKLVLDTASDEWRSMTIFGLYTGQRLGDLATLRWSAIDLEQNEIRFLTRKTGHPILIPIAAPLKAHILKMEAPDDPEGYLHPTLAESYERSGSGKLSNQFTDILATCGLRPKVSHRKKADGRNGQRDPSLLSFHSLRATAVTRMHEAGVPASMVEQWVGHNSKDVHRRYVKHGREALENATAQLPSVL